jgi:hypothetical protein
MKKGYVLDRVVMCATRGRVGNLCALTTPRRCARTMNCLRIVKKKMVVLRDSLPPGKNPIAVNKYYYYYYYSLLKRSA